MSDIAVTSTRSCICGTWQHSCWRARCRHCKKWLTKHDYTRDEAAEYSDDHVCGEQP